MLSFSKYLQEGVSEGLLLLDLNCFRSWPLFSSSRSHEVNIVSQDWVWVTKRSIISDASAFFAASYCGIRDSFCLPINRILAVWNSILFWYRVLSEFGPLIFARWYSYGWNQLWKRFNFNSELVLIFRMINFFFKHWILGLQLMKVVGVRHESLMTFY